VNANANANLSVNANSNASVKSAWHACLRICDGSHQLFVYNSSERLLFPRCFENLGILPTSPDTQCTVSDRAKRNTIRITFDDYKKLPCCNSNYPLLPTFHRGFARVNNTFNYILSVCLQAISTITDSYTERTSLAFPNQFTTQNTQTIATKHHRTAFTRNQRFCFLQTPMTNSHCRKGDISASVLVFDISSPVCVPGRYTTTKLANIRSDIRVRLQFQTCFAHGSPTTRHCLCMHAHLVLVISIGRSSAHWGKFRMRPEICPQLSTNWGHYLIYP